MKHGGSCLITHLTSRLARNARPASYRIEASNFSGIGLPVGGENKQKVVCSVTR